MPFLLEKKYDREFSLHVNEDGKPVLSLELMSKEFAKTLLCKIVDDAIIES